METQTALQTTAAEARSWFHQHQRSENDTIWTLKDGRPQWVQDMAFAAHDSGDMLPDDWRYEFIVDALDALEENEDPDDIALEADIHTSDLCRWLGSRADRTGYCDEAMEEFGGDFKDTVSLLQLGQWHEKREVLDSVRSFLVSRISDMEDETDDDSNDDE